jgi:hypothetical protein
MANYFEDQKYFDQFSQEILSQYIIPDFDISNIKEILAKVELNNSICMNVRRKEFVTTRWHIPIDYQEQAMNFIAANNLIENPRYFVISDDIPLVKKELKAYKNIEYIDGIKSLEALYILTHCSNNIMTRSTFSWWGSYLNNKNGFTIVPCNYYDLFKSNSLTYKIQVYINRKLQCKEYPYSHTNHTILYKDINGRNIVEKG